MTPQFIARILSADMASSGRRRVARLLVAFGACIALMLASAATDAQDGAVDLGPWQGENDFSSEIARDADDAGYLDANIQAAGCQDASFLQCSSGNACGGPCCDCNACCAGNTRQPASWISGPYFKSGVNFVLGKGLLVDQLDVGYTIAGGVRQPLGPGLGGDHLFFDLGGSYLSAFGNTTRTTDAAQFSTLTNDFQDVVPDAFTTVLTEVRRASVHCGLGWYWGEPFDDRSRDPQFRMATSFGGRYGHVRGDFVDRQIVAPPAGSRFVNRISQTDTVGGIYFNAQAILMRRHTALGHLQWTLDGEFAHDWVDFEGFEERGLATASILIGVLFSR